MHKKSTLSVDPASPQAVLEHEFFEQGETPQPDLGDDYGGGRRWPISGGALVAGVGAVVVVTLVIVGAVRRHNPPAKASKVAKAAVAPVKVAVAQPAAAQVAPKPALPSAVPAVALPPTSAPAAAPIPETAPAPAPAPVETTKPDTDALKACQTAVRGGKSKKTIALCTSAFEANPDSVETALLLAEMELDRGQTKEALRWAQRALGKKPDLADAYVIVGSAEQGAGRREAARSAYLRYLALEPNGRYASDVRAVVRGL